jgi:hypothetical protein
VNEKDIERAPPVSSSALRTVAPLSRLEFVLGQI